jgi:N-methylhydantoinase B
VIIGGPDARAVDQPATDAARALLAADRPDDPALFDRGPGYTRLSGGRTYAEVDLR